MKWTPSSEQILALATDYNSIVETTKDRSEGPPVQGLSANEAMHASMAKVLAEAMLEKGCPPQELVEWTRVSSSRQRTSGSEEVKCRARAR